MITGGVLSINLLFSLAVYMDAHNRNEMASRELNKVGYRINNDKPFTNFMKDYLVCFIPGVNLIKYFSNVSKSSGQYTYYRLSKLKQRKLVNHKPYKVKPKENNITKEESIKNTQSNDKNYYLILSKLEDLSSEKNVEMTLRKR